MATTHLAQDITISEVGDPSTGIALAAAAFEYKYDKSANLAKYVAFIQQAAERGATFLAFPEQSLQGYVWEPEMAWDLHSDVLQYHYENSETVPGEATEQLCALAKEHDMVIAVGMTERHAVYGKGKGGLFNSGVLLSGEGILGVHRKAHSCGTEKHIYQRGRDIDVTDTPVGRIGMAICYDLWFPETARVAAVKGADVLAFLTVWPEDFAPPIPDSSPDVERWDYYHSLLRVRAVENQMWIVAASGAGTDDRSGWVNLGQAKIVGPDGVTLVETPPMVEGIAIAHGCNIDQEIIRSRTKTYWGDSFLFDRNPGAYGALVDEHTMYPPPLER